MRENVCRLFLDLIARAAIKENAVDFENSAGYL